MDIVGGPKNIISHNIKIPRILNTAMQDQAISPQTFKFFTQVNQKQLEQLKNIKIITSNTFFMKENFPQKTILTLTEELLVLQSENSSILFGTDFHSQLKFRTLKYDSQLKMIGLQFVNEKTGEFQNFYCSKPKVVQTFTKYLLKKINHLGFHHLFKPMKKLGKGNFATVFQVARISDRKVFAVKAFSKAILNADEKGKQVLNHQINILKKIKHQNLLQLQGVYESQNSMYIVCQLLNGGTLHNALQKQFPQTKIKGLIKGLLEGLEYLHGQKIVHRDIKLENIMFRDEDCEVPVLIDFGLSTFYNQDKHIYVRCGTPGFIAPQILYLKDLQNPKFYPQSDVFAIGVIFYLLLAKKPLFKGDTPSKVFEKNKKLDFDFQELKAELRDEEYDLLNQMLKIDNCERVSSSEALKKEYFQEKVVSPALTNTYIEKEIELLLLK